MASTFGVVLMALAAGALGGCASVQVRSVATNTGQAAYDITGPDLGALTAEAVRLCPQGHVALRQWGRSNRPVGESDPGSEWLLRTAAFSYDLRPDQAQMSIACKA